MPDARTTILDRIRRSVGETSAVGAATEHDALTRNYVRAGRLDISARLRLFVARLRDYDANVVETQSSAIPRTILEVLRQHRQEKVIVADGIDREILPSDFPFQAEAASRAEDLESSDGIVTVCTVAIASTGSIVLTHGPGEGSRRLTLLPDRHLCVVRTDQVVETVPEAFDRLANFATRPLTFISGPSATADIEMTRIRGVHGPRFLDVVLAHPDEKGSRGIADEH